MLLYDDALEHVARRAAVDEVGKAHGAGAGELHPGVEGKKGDDDVGEPHARIGGAADRGEVAELRAHDVVDAVGEDVARHAREALVVLELAERDHGADDKGVVGLLDLVQAAAGQVDTHRDGSVGEAKPHHSAYDGRKTVFLQKVVGLLRGGWASILLEFEHGSSSVALLTICGAGRKYNFTTGQRPFLISSHALRCVFWNTAEASGVPVA